MDEIDDKICGELGKLNTNFTTEDKVRALDEFVIEQNNPENGI